MPIMVSRTAYMYMHKYISPSSSFRWIKDGEDFDPSSDPELKVSERTGSSAFYTLSNTMDSVKQYQGTYICLASNELGTAVSNEAKLKIDGTYCCASRELARSLLKVELGKHSVTLCWRAIGSDS